MRTSKFKREENTNYRTASAHIAMYLFFITVLLFNFNIITHAAKEPKSDIENPYYIIVNYVDLSSAYEGGYYSCNNSEGYIVIPTVKQDGTPGTTWWAKVNAGEWNERNKVKTYYLHSDGGTDVLSAKLKNSPIDGFPTEVRFVKTLSETSTDYITNNNLSETTCAMVQVAVSGTGDDHEYIYLDGWQEVTGAYGSWSKSRKIDMDKYKPHPYSVFSLDGPDELNIPNSGEITSKYTCRVYDQYQARWYKDNDGLNFLATEYEGISINNSGELKLSSEAAVFDYDDTETTFTVKIHAFVPNSNDAENDRIEKNVTVHYPTVYVSYYDDDGTKLGGPYEAYLYSKWSSYVHKIENPTKAPVEKYHYIFFNWKKNTNYPYVFGNTIFTANYSKRDHEYDEGEVTKDPTCTEEGEMTYTCKVCGYTKAEVVPVPALGHDYSFSSEEFSDDMSKLTITYRCRHNKDHFYTEEIDTNCTYPSDTYTVTKGEKIKDITPALPSGWEWTDENDVITDTGNLSFIARFTFTHDSYIFADDRRIPVYVKDVDPDPVNPDPVNPDPVNPDPFNPDPVNPDPVNPDPVKPDPVNPDPVKPDPVNPASETEKVTDDAKKETASDSANVNTNDVVTDTVSDSSNVKVNSDQNDGQDKDVSQNAKQESIDSKLKTTTLAKPKAGKKSITIAWKKQTKGGIKGYEIQYSTDKKFKEDATKTISINKAKTTTKTIKKLKSKTKYYIRIRTFTKKKGEKVYSKWSKPKNVKVK